MTDSSTPREPSPGDANSDGRGDDLRAALTGLARLSMKSDDLSEMLTHIAQFAVQAIPRADGAGLTLLHAERPDTIVATSHFVHEVDAIQYRIEEGPCITAADTGTTMRSGSLDTDPRWPQFGPRSGRLGVHSVLSLPLIAQHRTLGAMNVYSKAVDAFDDSAVALGESFAVPAAVTVQNAHALSDAVRLARQLERALHSRSDIDQAIGIIISRTGVSAADALSRLRTMSHRENSQIRDVAARTVQDAARRARPQRP